MQTMMIMIVIVTADTEKKSNVPTRQLALP